MQMGNHKNMKENYKMTGEEILQALGDIAYYNGHEKEIKKVIEYIEHYKGQFNNIIPMPEFLEKNDCDYYINILWQLSVMLYGDYGTSPRSGWLEAENKDKILDIWKYIYSVVQN